MKVNYTKLDDNNLIISRAELTRLLGNYALLQNTKLYNIKRGIKISDLQKELKQYKYVVEEIQKCLDEYFKSYHRVYEENQVEYDYLVGIENLIGQLKGADKE